MVVDFPNGKETGTVMMKTTMTVATMMVEIVAVMMSTPHFVLPVNVLIQHHHIQLMQEQMMVVTPCIHM